MIAIFIAVAFLSSCGLTPVYQRQAATGGLSTQIDIDPIPDRGGQLLRNELQNLFPRGSDPAAYRLAVVWRESIDDFGIRRDLTATFARLTVTANYQLWDLRQTTPNAAPVLTGTVRSINSYNILANTFATLTAEDDARAKAGQQLAREIQLRLTAYFKQ
jgi:LPS-assembly lipoprotein